MILLIEWIMLQDAKNVYNIELNSYQNKEKIFSHSLSQIDYSFDIIY